MSTNKPYVKKYNESTGLVDNPITKENPYLVAERSRGGKKFRKSNNTQGIRLLVTKIGKLSFLKQKVVNQLVVSKKPRKKFDLVVHTIN